MLQNLTGWHALIVLAVVLLFFGAAKLPRLAKSLGESARILKTEVQDSKPAETAAPTSPVATAPVVTTAPVTVPADAAAASADTAPDAALAPREAVSLADRR
ncbi:twin-arginine translocase TatA/TatE family subunit [Herbiconiux sp. CPCC 205716]|uniref:Sec-independent protein translocase protein TatA n=1 Tax=Herbiconiux gentiana TaxID=2970912 RepID=A0ABT2GBH3_9MICO|nr:twin-arginine translocase TatA/TatE family subunit [Herbiconiux gentiana]MCS5713557.1 twin-arginine translocase TatA/TatE family subunit [Herbiconiux gentiana]